MPRASQVSSEIASGANALACRAVTHGCAGQTEVNQRFVLHSMTVVALRVNGGLHFVCFLIGAQPWFRRTSSA
jgi:hypothetical protein